MNYIIRKAFMTDMNEIIKLCEEHAVYEQAQYSAAGKATKLEAHLFGETPRLYCLIAESENSVVGYATYMFELSTWDADFYTHMDCLYLQPHARGYGIGEAFIKEIAGQTKINGYNLIQWQTPVFNKKAIKFYYRIGATSKEKLRMYMNKDAIDNLLK